jgi:hypothetical protein
MLVTAFLSMWISNTATTAMMVPIAHAVLEQLHGTKKDIEEGNDNPAFELQESSTQKEETKLGTRDEADPAPTPWFLGKNLTCCPFSMVVILDPLGKEERGKRHSDQLVLNCLGLSCFVLFCFLSVLG